MTRTRAAVAAAVLSGAVAAAAAVPVSTAGGQTTRIRRAQPAVAVWASGGGRLGIAVREVDERDVKSGRLGSAHGAVVEEVSEGSAAEKAGVRRGDIIVEFDGERVRSARQLTRLVQETADNRTVPAVVVRDGQRTTLQVEAGEGRGFAMPAVESLARNFAYELPARPALPPNTPRSRAFGWTEDLLGRDSGRLGITVDDLSPQLAEYFGTTRGVLVTSVRADSVAATAGLKAGDVITGVNDAAVESAAELRRRLLALDEGSDFTLAVMRDKKAQTLKGTLESSARRREFRTIL